MAKNRTPDYSPMLDAYHTAFAPELKRMVAELPFLSGDHIVDVGCGDGIYSGWIAEQIAPSGAVTAVDASQAYLQRARKRLARHPNKNLIHFATGKIEKLPFKSGRFDGAWCAQSLFSFPDPVRALAEMQRIVRPGGIVAVLENDAFHQILLPWPIDVELSIHDAMAKAYDQKRNDLQKACVGRALRPLFVEAKLKPQRKKLYASQREAPLSSAEERFLRLYLQNIRQTIRPYLPPARVRRVESYLDPRAKTYLIRQPELAMTCLDYLIWGKKP